jgi:histidine kinase
MGDANQLEQVFLNLIANARDAIEEAGGLKKELTITSRLSEDGGAPSVLVSVKDTGVGIPPRTGKDLRTLFQHQAGGKRHGLGLSLCFGIVEAHGGRIDIKSRSERGRK